MIRMIYPEDHEENDVLDDPQWLTMGFEHYDCEFEMIKLHKEDPRIGEFSAGVMGTPKVV